MFPLEPATPCTSSLPPLVQPVAGLGRRDDDRDGEAKGSKSEHDLHVALHLDPAKVENVDLRVSRVRGKQCGAIPSGILTAPIALSNTKGDCSMHKPAPRSTSSLALPPGLTWSAT